LKTRKEDVVNISSEKPPLLAEQSQMISVIQLTSELALCIYGNSYVPHWQSANVLVVAAHELFYVEAPGCCS